MSFAYDASVRAAEDSARRLDTAEEELAAALADVARLTAERDAALAIIAGRDVAPTDEELEVHHAAGGAWVLVIETGAFSLERSSLGLIRYYRDGGHVTRWIALDATGRPCAWPTVMP